ncbi:MAG: ATP-dependent acyl-CoA ligase [Burkholderiales bacterium]|nr:ATP-dependent acyl-CoA ligase [Burkholderiales bacterium]
MPPHPRTVPGLLAERAAREPERPLFACGDASWSIARAESLAAGHAGALAAAGLARGERVAIFSGNRPEFMRVFLGCAWLGAVAVPVNVACRGPQLQYYLANSGARLLCVERALLAELAQVDPAAVALEAVWVMDAQASAPGAAPDVSAAGPHWAARTVAMPAPAAPVEPAPLAPGDTVAILYTSGTTGPSKGVCCPHAQLIAWGEHTARLLGVTRDDVLCTTLPLFHVNALNGFFQALSSGARQVVEPRFSVSAFWPTMARHGATVGYLLGAMVPMLLARGAAADERGHRLRIALAPGVPPALHARFRERTGVVLLEGYGSTETNFVIAARPGEGAEGTMGVLQPGFSARVADANDVELPPGEAGELLLRADAPFAFATGYWGMPQQTLEAWRNLWFHTGDRVVRDAEGRFRFVDRLKDAIRRRGENISSHEVEQVLLSHPSIAAAAVFPVRSELAEDEVMVALVPRTGAAIDPVELVRFCETRLPHFAVPRYLDVVDDLPRTENGKVRKVVLRERGVGPSTWDREAAGVVVARRR